jgi:Glycosyl hydrolases family 16
MMHNPVHWLLHTPRRTQRLRLFTMLSTTFALVFAATAFLNKDVALSTSWQRFSLTYASGVTDPGAILWFSVAQTTGKVWVDNVSLTGSQGTPATATPLPTSTPTPLPTPTPSPTPTGTPQPYGQSGIWKMTFDDEFNGNSLNTSTWTPGWFGAGVTSPTNSSETACYDASQVSEPGDGYLHLHLVARRERCNGNTYSYTGSLVSTNPSDGVAGHIGFQFTYGYVEWHVYLPAASAGVIANWPGVWSNGQSWPTDGENDTMEGLSGQACYHFLSPAGGPGGCATGDYTGWHIFATDWEPGVVTYYYDGVQVGQITSGITSAPQYLIMDNTTNASSPTAVPADMLIDYVRVWQK